MFQACDSRAAYSDIITNVSNTPDCANVANTASATPNNAMEIRSRFMLSPSPRTAPAGETAAPR
ncbi:hypothetical protein D3C78_1674930 [compost metagenome]